VLAGDESFLELRGEPGFEVHGPVSRQFLTEKLYPAADAFAMPSRAEGYGFTLVEAMSHGLPVISSTYGSIPEVVEHGVTGLLTPVGDADALVDAMSTLATDRAAARAMGGAGRSRFEAEFTRERFLDRTRAWYDRARAQG
jgi:glycosyltransferase involved in cell wall biosynthesis